MRYLGILVTVLVATSVAAAQDPPASAAYDLAWTHVSGFQVNDGVAPAIVDLHEIHVAGAARLRVFFEEISIGVADKIVVRSPLTGMTHELTPEEAAKWRNSSGYFNGDRLDIELHLAPGSIGSYRIQRLEVESGLGPITGDTICGVDDRVVSNDSRVARLEPIGCTVWLVGTNNCAISAGHCFSSGNGQVAEFNVPPSLPSGANQSPPIEDQYPIDLPTINFTNGGTGNDWGTCVMLPNNLGQDPLVNQTSFQLTFAVPTAGDTIRITGHGTDSGVANQVQQTHAGPSAGNTGTALHYETDTTGGNSGSPVIDEATNTAVGVHTHGGCGATSGFNTGTSVTLGAFQASINATCSFAPTAPPVAAFESSATETVVGGSITFSDASSQFPNAWMWDLDGDGSVDSTSEVVTFQYTAAGVYDVTLTVMNGLGTDVLTLPGLITVHPMDIGQPNMPSASLELSGATDQNGLTPIMGQNGPFFATYTGSDLLEMTMKGLASQPVLLLAGPLNRGNGIFAGVGSLDIGLNGAGGNFGDVTIVLDGFTPMTLLDNLSNTGSLGTRSLSFSVGGAPPGTLGTLQAVMAQGAGAVALTAATEIVIQ